MKISKFILGTAQLTQNYGIANISEDHSDNKSKNILENSLNYGIKIWDTSPEYGQSEKIIGSFIKKYNPKVDISTKLPSIVKKHGNNLKPIELEKIVLRRIEKSLKNLNKESIDLYYIHDENDLITYGDDLNYFLLKSFDQGKINKIGISVYNIDLLLLFNKEQMINTVQIPINIFNRKYVEAIKILSKKKINILARSVFLQGLFFLDPKFSNDKVPMSSTYLLKLLDLKRKYNLSTADIAFGYVNSFNHLSGIILGVDNNDQLKFNVGLFNAKKLKSEIINEINHEFYNIPLELVDPRKWN
ncbi:aldo/keto reductase [Candidatus Woesearchaeota archaeon]|nr:aldo/keto reductase [Candidatus Woesearchaeota archaeon]